MLNFCAVSSPHAVLAAGLRDAVETREMIIAAGSVLLLGLLCDAYLLSRFAFSRRIHLPDGRLLKVEPKSWDIPELLVALSAILVVFLLSNSFYWLVSVITGRTLIQLSPVIVTTELFLRLVILAAFFHLMRRRNVSVSRAFGLHALSSFDAVVWGIVFGLASLPPVQLLVVASGKLFRAVGIDSPEQPIAALFATTDSRVLLSLLVVFALVVAPVFEEFFFRGFAYPALKRRLGPWRAIVLVSGVFAFTHGHLPSLLPLFVLALGLNLAYELTGSLLVPIGMHALFNAIMVAKLLFERMQS